MEKHLAVAAKLIRGFDQSPNSADVDEAEPAQVEVQARDVPQPELDRLRYGCGVRDVDLSRKAQSDGFDCSRHDEMTVRVDRPVSVATAEMLLHEEAFRGPVIAWTPTIPHADYNVLYERENRASQEIVSRRIAPAVTKLGALGQQWPSPSLV